MKAAAYCLCVFAALVVGSVAAARGEEPALAPEDRKLIDELLPGVLGKAVPAERIADVAAYFPLEETPHHYRLTSGKDKGKTEIHKLARSERSKTSWRYIVGESDVHHLEMAADGSVRIAATVENAHQVISRFAPREPGLLAGLEPGAVKKEEVAVKVYDLAEPEELSHEGTLEVTYTYVGAYEVKVPAGTYRAALIKWHYRGKIGPANFEDVQLRFIAKGAGIVASVDKKNISAFLVYSDKTKIGRVRLSE